jgi:ubiquinone/menaquinone biosynthesis C-methylase UbiE
MSTPNRYDQSNIDTMEMVYGRGYLSGGGDEEVVKILDGINLRDAHVLDLGCGMGGATLAMLSRLEAHHVTGFDIDSDLLIRADELVREGGYEDRCTLVAGSPGPLPFEDKKFDCVYMTAVSCHLEDLPGFFRDIHRVLKPGGILAGCEWLIREHNVAFHAWNDMLRERGLNFYFAEHQTFRDALNCVPFDAVELRERTDGLMEFSRSALARVESELRAPLIESLGEAGFEALRTWAEVRYFAMRDGGMQQSHFRARRPAVADRP